METELSPKSLRSRGQLIVTSSHGTIWVWSGVKSNEQAEKVAIRCAEGLAIRLGKGEWWTRLTAVIQKTNTKTT